MNDLNLLDKLPSSGKQRGEVAGRRLLLAVAIVGGLSCVLVWLMMRAVPFGTPSILLGVLLGVFLAAPFLPCILLSLLEAPLGVRAAGIACTLMLFAAATFVGLLISGTSLRSIEELARYVLPAAPAVVGSMLLPFLMVRYLFGWQIVMRNWNKSAERQNVSVAGLMLATMYVGVCVVMLMRSPAPVYSGAVCAWIVGVGIILLTPYVYLTVRGRMYWIHLLTFCFIAVGAGVAYGAVAVLVYRVAFSIDFFILPVVVFSAGTSWLGLGFIAVRFLGGELVLNSDFGTAD